MAEARQVLTAEHATVGTALPTLRVTESQDTILGYNDIQLAGRLMTSNIHTDEEFARQNIFGGAVNAGPATMSYVEADAHPVVSAVCVLLRRPACSCARIEPFRAGHVVTLRGEVTGGHRLWEITVGSAVPCAAPINWARSSVWPKLP